MEVIPTNDNTLKKLLLNKAIKEQTSYVEHLKALPPKQIIDSAYEKVMRDDILLTFEDDYLSDKQIEELIKLDCPLYVCYEEWMKMECTHMEMLRDTIYNYTKRLIEKKQGG